MQLPCFLHSHPTNVARDCKLTPLDRFSSDAVMPDGTLDDSYQRGTTDGWRDAEGNWKGWSDDIDNAPYFYVKADFTRSTEQLYEIGGYPGHTDEPVTFTAIYAFVKKGSTEAVILKVNLSYTKDDAVVGISADTEKAVIYDLAGRRVSNPQKGVFIVNGKKVAVK